MDAMLKPQSAAVGAPEADLTPEAMIARAVALRDMIRADQDEAEARGTYSEALHREFLNAGFYRALQPKMFGGYEFPVSVFYKTMLEVSRGDPGIGWCLTLCASHPFLVASHWPEAAQQDFFREGFFASPHRPTPGGRATPVPGGYTIDGTWDYCSGIPHSSHFIGGALLLTGEGPPLMAQVCIPKDKVTVLDDWGQDRTLGMRASGSNSVKVENVFVPEHHLVTGSMMWASPDDIVAGGGTPGTHLHGNPMYLGRVMGPYHMSLVTPVIGAARAAIDEFEEILRTRKTAMPPVVLRAEHIDFQRALGQALTLTDAAEAIMIRGGEIYMETCERWGRDGRLFTTEDNMRLWGMLQHAGQLACQAVEIVFNAAGSSAARKGHRIQRYYRDCAMYKGHMSSQPLNFAAPVGRARLGLKLEMFGI